MEDMPMIDLPERVEEWVQEPRITQLYQEANGGKQQRRGEWGVGPGIVIVMVDEIRRLRTALAAYAALGQAATTVIQLIDEAAEDPEEIEYLDGLRDALSALQTTKDPVSA